MSDLPTTRKRAVEAFVARVRAEAALGPVAWRIALFAVDTAGWRTIVLDPDGMNDLDAPIIWGANRLARIIAADAAAFVEETPDGAVVYLERRGERQGIQYVIGRGATEPVAEPISLMHEILPGGDPGGWGDLDHDSVELVP